MVDLNSETLFNGAAATVATIAALVFIVNVEFDYSPVSKVALVLAFLAGILLITQRTGDYQLTVLGYGVIVTSSVALFFDVVNTFGVGDALTALGLLGIAALLFALRTRLGEDHRFVTGTQATYLFGVLAALAAGVLLVDVVTGGLAYELRPESHVEVVEEPHGQPRIASLAVTNPTPFPERVDAPRYGACAAGNWSAFRPPPEPGEPEREVQLHVDVRSGYNEYVFGYGTRTYPVSVYLDGTDIRGETFPVEVTSGCPDDETGAAYVALFEAPEDRPYGYAR